MEGVLLRPGGTYFGANNGTDHNMMFLCNDHRIYYRKKYHAKYTKAMAVRCGKKDDSMVVLEKGENDEKKKNNNNNNKKMIKKQKMMIKDKSKLLKGLSMDFTGLLLDSHKLQLQEASEVLLSQLKELKSEHKELKKKMKEEKAKSKAASTCSSSSSSSSESSDSDCEREVLDMNRLKHETYAQPPSSITINEEVFHQQPPQIVQENAAPIIVMEKYTMPESEQDRNNSLLSLLEEKKAEENNNDNKKIEVCMGGKCKKSGSGELLEEFRRVVGETAPCVDVIGCKCMGKCRDGPNVRLVSTPQAPPIDDFNVVFIDDELHPHHRQVNLASAAAITDTNTLSVLAKRSLKRAQRSSHPLCIGVGLEDVGFIVSKITGQPVFVQDQC